MKNLALVGLISILFYTNAHTNEGWVRVPVTGLQETEIERIFEINSSNDFAKIQLDCLSFIHGMNFYDKEQDQKWELSYSFPLTESSCHDIYNFIKDSLRDKLPICVELNIIDNIYQLSRKEESCQLGS